MKVQVARNKKRPSIALFRGQRLFCEQEVRGSITNGCIGFALVPLHLPFGDIPFSSSTNPRCVFPTAVE